MLVFKSFTVYLRVLQCLQEFYRVFKSSPVSSRVLQCLQEVDNGVRILVYHLSHAYVFQFNLRNTDDGLQEFYSAFKSSTVSSRVLQCLQEFYSAFKSSTVPSRVLQCLQEVYNGVRILVYCLSHAYVFQF